MYLKMIFTMLRPLHYASGFLGSPAQLSQWTIKKGLIQMSVFRLIWRAAGDALVEVNNFQQKSVQGS